MHVLCIQDPSNSAPFSTIGKYKFWYATSRPLKYTDNPKILKDRSKEVPLYRVAFYVHEDVPRWSVALHPGENEKLAATLTLQTDCGPLDIHNVYNPDQKVNIAELIAVRKGGATIYIGDMNAHNEQWCQGAHTIRPGPAKDAGDELYYAMQEANMTLLSEPGRITWRKKVGPESQQSVIDLVWASSAIAGRFVSCEIDHGAQGITDHVVIETKFNMEIDCTTTARLLWAKDAEEEAELDDATNKAFKNFELPTINCTDDINDLTGRLLEVSRSTLVSTCRVAGPRPQWSDPGNTPAVQQLRDQANKALQEAEALSTPYEGISALFDDSSATPDLGRSLASSGSATATRQEALLSDHKEYHRRADALVEKERTKAFRQAVQEGMRDNRKAFQYARKAERWFEPKPVLPVPVLHVVPDDRRSDAADAASKDEAFRHRFWKTTSDDKSIGVDQSYEFLPDEQKSQPAIESELGQSTSAKELEMLIKKLKLRREPGFDIIPNEFLRLGKGVLIPILLHLFNACLAFSYVPPAFKADKTHVVPKKGRPLEDPGNWRPIALISTIGKLLEKVMLRRINLYVTRLAKTQHGCAGKCTTKALQCLLNPVYRGWTLPKRLESTLLTFDIRGAFNSVNHSKLLKALEAKGIPMWIVKFIASYLSNRETTLILPGHDVQKSFFVNVGVPQGSPLASILFLFFASPLLEKFAKMEGFGKKVNMVSYADDTTLVVLGEDHTKNSDEATEYFATVKEWADENEVTFAPLKYEVMHFQQPRTENHPLGSDQLPHIPDDAHGEVKVSLKHNVKVLGIIVDERLTWKDHVLNLKIKAARLVAIFSRLSTSSLGPSRQQLKKFFITKVRPMLAYGCGAWYLRPDSKERNRWSLSKTSVSKLEAIENDCFRQITGAYQTSPTMCLREELQLESLESYLERAALTFQARAIETEHSKNLAKLRMEFNKSKNPAKRAKQESDHLKELDRHPYHVFDRQAREVTERAIQAKIEVSDLLKAQAKYECVQDWKEYRIQYFQRFGINNKERPAVRDGWGKKVLKYYENMDRCQSTMLFLCRVGHIGLRKYLYVMGVSSPRSWDW